MIKPSQKREKGEKGKHNTSAYYAVFSSPIFVCAVVTFGSNSNVPLRVFGLALVGKLPSLLDFFITNHFFSHVLHFRNSTTWVDFVLSSLCPCFQTRIDVFPLIFLITKNQVVMLTVLLVQRYQLFVTFQSSVEIRLGGSEYCLTFSCLFFRRLKFRLLFFSP